MSGNLKELQARVRELERAEAERKLVEEKLRESEARFRNLAQTTSTAIMVYQNDRWIYANPAAEKMCGYTLDGLREMNFWDFVAPGYVDRVKQMGRNRQRMLNAESGYEFEIVTRDGERKWVYLEGTSAEVDGKPAGLISVTDITKRKRAEEALKKSHQGFIETLESLNELVIQLDSDYTIKVSNRAASTLMGIPREQFPGKHCYSLFYQKQSPCDGCPAREAMLTGKPSSSLRHRPDGTILSRTVYPIKAEDGTISGATILATDITEQKQTEAEKEKLQQRLMQTTKLESVGRLAGGVAHDFNNMLSVIQGHVEMLIDQLPEGSELAPGLQEIRLAARRSTDIVDQLLAFARKQNISPRSLDLNSTVESMLSMIERLIGEDINLSWKPANELWPVKLDPSQVSQILANLCVNARDAIRGVGSISICTENFHLKEDESREDLPMNPGDYVLMSVTDDGPGMDEATSRNIFEPFFTTKDVGQGTGLGLSTVYGIVKQNDGFISVESVPAEGTCFRLYLPSHDQDVRENSGAASPDSPPGGSETILLVEDEVSILEMTARMLKIMGYCVLKASLPQKAIELAENHPGTIHLLITDVVMPEMNGRVLARKVLKLHPELRCLFMSGYTADVIANRGVLKEGVQFIQKPFSSRDLAKKIKQTLEQPPSFPGEPESE